MNNLNERVAQRAEATTRPVDGNSLRATKPSSTADLIRAMTPEIKKALPSVNKPLNNAEYKEFCQKIELLYLEAFPCQTVIHHRKDRTIGTATLKKILTEYDVLVERSKKGTHIFKRQRSDE